MTATVYLAGPILDMTKDGANGWRDYAIEKLAEAGVRGISPLRCEPLVGKVYKAGYSCPKFGTAKAIGSKNLFDVRNCDMVIAYIPTPEEGKRHSWGTMAELSWAYILGKPAILVSDDPLVRGIRYCRQLRAGWYLI